MDHLPYTPKLAPRNFHQSFGHNKLLAAKQFASCHLLSTDTWHRFPLCWYKNNWCLSGINACMSMVIMCLPDVYHLLPTCHVHIKIRKQFSALHCLLPTSWNTFVQTAVQFKFPMHSCYHNVIVGLMGARCNVVGWGTALQVGRSWVRFPMVSLEFFIDKTVPASLWPWGWLSL